MVDLEPTAFIDAFRLSSGEDDADLYTTEDMYRLGQLIDEESILNFDPSYNIKQHPLMGSWDIKNSKGNYKLTDIPANYKLTNGILFMGMLGKKSNVTTNQRRTITHLDTDVAIAEKPRYNLLTHSGTDKRQIFGCVLKEASVSWEINKGYVEAQTKYDALSWDTSSWTGDNFHPGAAVDADGEFKPFSIMETLDWDSSGNGGADAGPINSPFGCSLQMAQELKISPGVGANLGMNEEIDDSLGISAVLALSYWGNEAQFITDHKEDNMGTLVWKMAKPDTAGRDLYYEVTATNCSVFKPMPFRKNGEPVGYATLMRAEHLSIDIQDYINNYFYTYPSA